MENPHLNTFRRLGARMVGGAYVEGWGLYSERLADEMGLFRDEAERFGMLDAQAWRAARLVVDTGLHALRWPRQRSIDFLSSAGLSETDAVIETDRYIAWPGQALTYKVGQREIERLRGRAGGARRVGVRPPGVPRRGARATARCRWRRSAASSRTGWPRRSDRRPGTARALHGHRDVPVRAGARLRPGGGTRADAPPGLRFVDSWVDADRLDRCFQLMETDDPDTFQAWIAAWADLVAFEVVPVVDSAAAAAKSGAASGPGSERRVDRRRGHATTDSVSRADRCHQARDSWPVRAILA